jgi:hypothetical protein
MRADCEEMLLRELPAIRAVLEALLEFEKAREERAQMAREASNALHEGLHALAAQAKAKQA